MVMVQIGIYLNSYEARLSTTQVKKAGYLSSEEHTCLICCQKHVYPCFLSKGCLSLLFYNIYNCNISKVQIN